MEWWHVYLFTRLDKLGVVLVVALAVGVVGLLFAAISWGMDTAVDNHEEARKARQLFVKMAWAASVAALLVVVVPSQKEVAAIYLLPKLARSDFAIEAQQIPTDAAKLMRLKLESWIADMEPQKPKK